MNTSPRLSCAERDKPTCFGCSPLSSFWLIITSRFLWSVHSHPIRSRGVNPCPGRVSVHSHTDPASHSVLCEVTVTSTGILTSNQDPKEPLPLQTVIKRSATAKLLKTLALHSRILEIKVSLLEQLREGSGLSTQGAGAVLKGPHPSLRQIWVLCASRPYFQDLKMQDMALSGLG